MLLNSKLNKAIAVLNILTLSVSMVLFDLPFPAVKRIEPVQAEAAYQMNTKPDSNFWVTDQSINSIAVAPDGTTYLAGNFNYVGPNTGRGAVISKDSGEPVRPFPRINGIVRTAIPDGLGGWFVGGDFTNVAGQTRNRIAHIFADNTLDTGWDPNANDRVNSIFLDGSTLYVGGSFTNIGGQIRNRIAALDVSTGLATAWNPGCNNTVNSVVADGSVVYAGGSFTNMGGQIRSRIASVNKATGLTTGWNPGSNSTVYTLALDGSILYLGGAFINTGGQPRNYIAAFDTSTGLVTGWNPNANSSVKTVSKIGSLIYVGGNFSIIGGQSRRGLAAVNPAGAGAVTAFNANINGYVETIASDGIDNLFIGGGFDSAGGEQRNHIAAVSMTTGLASSWYPNPGRLGIVYALSVYDDSVFAGGEFKSIGGQDRNNLISIDALGNLTDWNPNPDQAVAEVSINGTTLYVSGSFTNIGGQPRDYLAAFDTQSGLLTGWQPSIDGVARAFEFDENSVYIGGDFTTVGAVTRNSLAAIDKVTGLATSWDPDVNGIVNTLAKDDSVIYAGGLFTAIGLQPRNRIGAIDKTTGLATAWDPNADNAVNSIALDGSTVYVGGSFSNIGGSVRSGLAAIDQSGAATAFNPGPDSLVADLLIDNSELFVAGNFNNIGGQPRKDLASFNLTTLGINAWNPSANNLITALAKNGPTLYAGGHFSLMANEPYAAVACFYDSSPSVTTLHRTPAGPNGLDGWYISKPTASFSTNKRAKTYYSWNTTQSYDLSTSSFEAPEGNNTLYYYSADRNNVESAVSEFVVKVDTITPSTSITSDPEDSNGQNGWFRSRPNIDLSNSDTGDIHYSWNSTASYNVYDSSLSGPDGTNILYYYAKDSAGNEEAVKSRQFKVDTEGPGSSNYQPANDSSGVSINALITAGIADGLSGLDETSISGTSFYLKDSGGATVSASVSFDGISGTATLTPDNPLNYLETYTAYLSADISDLAGNTHASQNWQFTTQPEPDTWEPSVQITNPAQDEIVSENIQINATVDDSDSGGSAINEAVFIVDEGMPVQMTAVDGNFDSPVENVKGQLNIEDLTAGQHTVIVLGKDSNGNWSQAGMVSVYVAKYSLVSLITYPNSKTRVSGQIHIKGSAYGLTGGKFARYVLQHQQINKPDGTLVLNPVWSQIALSKTPLEDATMAKWKTTALNGRYKLRLSVYDVNNNVQTAQSIIRIDNVKPLAMPLYPLDKSVVPAADTISVKITDDNSGVMGASLLLNDRLVDPEVDWESGILTYSPAEIELKTGMNKITVIAVDAAGNKTVYSYTFVLEPTGPTVSIERPASDEDPVPGTKKTPVIGSVWSASLKTWKLEYKRVSPAPSPFATVSSGTKSTKGSAILGALPVLTSGEYQVRLTAVNNGMMTSSFETTVNVANTSSYAASTEITDVAVGGGNLTATGSASHPNFASYKLFLKQTYPAAGSEALIYTGLAPMSDGILANLPVKGNGTYDLILRSYNSALAVIGENTYSGLKLDTALPKITSVYPTANSYINNEAPAILLNAIDPEPVKGKETRSGLAETAMIILDGEYFEAAAPGSAGTYTLSSGPLPDGKHQVSFKIFDKAGNAAFRESSFITDTMAPLAEISNLSNDQVLRGIYAVKGRVFDENISAYQLQYRLDSPSSSWSAAGTVKENTPVSGSTLLNWRTNSLNGKYYVRLVAIDKAQNKTFYPEGSDSDYQQAIKVTIDNKAPTLGPIFPKDKSHVRELPHIQISGAYDLNPKKNLQDTTGVDADKVTLEFNGVADLPASYDSETGKITYIEHYLEDGTYTAKFRVPDIAGNAANIKTTFTIDRIEPIAGLGLERSAVKAGNKLTIVGAAFDTNIAGWKLYQKHSTATTFSLIKSGTANVGSDDEQSTLAAWTAPVKTGSYELKLDVADKAGNQATQYLPVEVDTTSDYLDEAGIRYLTTGSFLRGKVPVNGTASTGSNFAYYTLSRKLSTSSTETLIYKGTSPVEAGLLGTFNTAGLNGTYDLVLRRFTNPSAPSQYGPAVTVTGLIVDNMAPVISGVSVLGSMGLPGFSKVDEELTLAIRVKETGAGIDKEKTKLLINGVLLDLDFEGNASFDAGTSTLYATIPYLWEGKHPVSVIVYDKASNPSKVTNTILTIDTDTPNTPTAPTAVITYPLEGSYHKGAVPIVGSAFDQNLLDYTLLAKKSTTDTYSVFFTGKTSVLDATLGSFKATDNGEYSVRLITRDKADNTFRQSTVGIIMDNIAPVSAVTKINGLSASTVTQVSGEVTLTGKAYDRGGLEDIADPNDSFVRYVVDYGAGSAPASWNTIVASTEPVGSEVADGQLCVWDTAAITPGPYVLRVRTFDKTGDVKELRKTLRIN